VIVARRHWEWTLLRNQVRDAVHAAHAKAAADRTDPDWIENERRVVANAANQAAYELGVTGQPVTVEDVERVERPAVGHVDYMSKLALYVAELVMERAA
jgi:hypothetical protein